MKTGITISGTVHVLFLLVLLFGGLFTRSRLPEMSVSEVSVISAEEFAALTAPEAAPEVDSEAADPEAPASEDTAPEIAALAEPPPDRTALDRPEAPPVADAPAEPLPLPERPETEVTDNLPPVEAPPVIDDRPDGPEEVTPAPAPRVAPEPAAPAPPNVESAPEVVEQTAPEPLPQEPVETQEAAAPEEATTEIVTEAETPTLAPASSPKPRARPARQVAATEPDPEPEPAPEPPDTAFDAIADAVATAMTDRAEPAPAVPAGPPLTSGEKDALRVSVQRCWNVGSLSSEALRTTVIVAVDMAQDGRPENTSIRMVDFDGGSEASARQAYEAARRAIIRCGASGFDLPVEKYAQWREIEMTFNPEGMRLR